MLFTLLVTGLIFFGLWCMYRAFGSRAHDPVERFLRQYFPASKTRLDATLRQLRNQPTFLSKVPKVFTQPHLLPDRFSYETEQRTGETRSGQSAAAEHSVQHQPTPDPQPAIAEDGMTTNSLLQAKLYSQVTPANRPDAQTESSEIGKTQKHASESEFEFEKIDALDTQHSGMPGNDLSAKGTIQKNDHQNERNSTTKSHIDKDSLLHGDSVENQQLNAKAIDAMKNSADIVKLRAEANKAQELSAQVQTLRDEASHTQETLLENKRPKDDIKYSQKLAEKNSAFDNENRNSAKNPDTNISRKQLFSPPSYQDDLKQIKGIGKVMERTLNELGVTTFKQLSELDSRDVERVSNALSVFPGRIERDEWVKQAQRFHKVIYSETSQS
jgi:predicted flap endonuclease-1-like 5' DNA nuclease